MKFDFEITITNKLGPVAELLRGFRVPAGQPRPYLVPIMTNHLNMLKTMLCDALLVATNLLNTNIKFYIFEMCSVFFR